MPAEHAHTARLVGAAAGVVATAGIVWLAMSQGAYDVVPRQTAGLLLWWSVGVAAVVRRQPFGPTSSAAKATALALVAIAVWIALDFGSSLSPERTATELARAVMHLGPLVLIGWVLPRHVWPWIWRGLAIGATAICVYALATRLSPGLAPVEFSSSINRLSSPLGYWNALGCWAVMTAALLTGVSTSASRTAVRGIAFAFVPTAVSVAYLTYSRSALGTAVVAAVLLIALSETRWTVGVHLAIAGVAGAITIVVIRHQPAIADSTGGQGWKPVLAAVVGTGFVSACLSMLAARSKLDGLKMPRRTALLTAGLTVVVLTTGASVLAASDGARAWNEFKNPVESSAETPSARLATLNGTRYLQWEAAIDAWEQHRWTGTGAGTFELTYNRAARDAEFVRDAHNAFVETLSEQGIPGLVLLVVLVFASAATVLVARARAHTPEQRGMIAAAGAAAGAFFAGTAIDWFWEVTALAVLAIALVGVAAAASAPPHDPAAPHPRRAAVGRPALVLVAILAVLIELPGLVGTSEIRRSQTAVARGDIETARARADEAINMMPWAASPFLQRGLVEERVGNFTEARRAVTLAQRRDPDDWRFPLILARIEAEAGQPAAALRAYRRAKSLRPHGKFFG